MEGSCCLVLPGVGSSSGLVYGGVKAIVRKRIHGTFSQRCFRDAEEEAAETARGSEHNFASDADITAKFQLLASRALPQAQIDGLLDRVMQIEDLADCSELARLLAVR